MALDVYVKDDVLNVLRAVYVASFSATAALSKIAGGESKETEAYNAGILAGLISVAEGFGLAQEEIRIGQAPRKQIGTRGTRP